MKTIKRLFWAAAASAGIIAATAAPSLAGTMINHNEAFNCQ